MDQTPVVLNFDQVLKGDVSAYALSWEIDILVINNAVSILSNISKSIRNL